MMENPGIKSTKQKCQAEGNTSAAGMETGWYLNKIGQTKISDEPWASKRIYRRIEFSGLSGKLELPYPIGNGY